MPDCVLRLWWENQYLLTVTTCLLMPFPHVFKSVGSVDVFNSPQVLGLLRNLKACWLWNKLYCYSWELCVCCRAVLQQWGRKNCILLHHIHPETFNRLPPLHVSVLWGNCPRWAHKQTCTSGQLHWAVTELRKEGAVLELRIAECMQWPAAGGICKGWLHHLCLVYTGMALVGLHHAFSQAKARYLQEKYKTRAMKLSFFYAFLPLLPFLHICQRILIHPTTQTPPDKSWGGAL